MFEGFRSRWMIAFFTWQRRQARKLGVAAPQAGGVTAIQRFGGALNLNVHLHSVLPDGVFDLSGSGPARFVALAAPSDEEIDRILRRIIRRAAKVVAACDANPEDREDALAELQATEVDRGQRLATALPHQRQSAMLDCWASRRPPSSANGRLPGPGSIAR